MTALAQDLPIDVSPTQVRLAAPARAPDGRFALCLSFRQPAESRIADRVIVALRDSAGIADTLRGPLDRTGPRTTCLHGVTSRAFVGVTLTAPRRMMVLQLDWRVAPNETVSRTPSSVYR